MKNNIFVFLLLSILQLLILPLAFGVTAASNKVLTEELVKLKKKVAQLEKLSLSQKAPATQESLRSSNVQPFEFHGYMRAGVGTNNKDGEQKCFSAPYSGNMFRLGNECTNYGELVFKANHIQDPSKGFMYTQFRLQFEHQGRSAYESEDAMRFTEAYVEGGNFDGVPLTFWGGKRYYRDDTVWADDYYFHAHMSANGGGIGNIDLLGSKLDIAYLKQLTNPSIDGRNGKREITFFDFRLKGIQFSQNQSMKLWFAYGIVPDDESVDGLTEYDKTEGFATSALFQTNFSGGFNQIAVVYGQSLLEGHSVWGDPNQIFGSDGWREAQNKKQYFVMDHLVFKLSNVLDIMMSAYVGVKDTGANVSNETKWYAAGITPLWYLTDHFQVMFQAGTFSSDDEVAGTKNLTRIAIAPQVSISRSVWGRPVIRAFYARSFWNDNYVATVGSPYNRGDSYGSNYGLQVEAWW